MELRLVVLAGAKQGTQIPLKKDKFIIGRAKDCTLRAGSEAISRRHCAILRHGSDWSVKDLGSRNGTYLNDQRIEAEMPLKAGDELRVGPLKFRVESMDAAPAAPPAVARHGKHPPVSDVADAAQRAAGKSDQTATEDDISRWLLGVVNPDTDESLRETRTVSMQETATLNKAKPSQAGPQAATPDPPAAEPADPQPAEDKNEDEADTDAKSTEKGGWSWLNKLGKGKKKPGRLPPRASTEPTKDSREAAADILREMTRRR